MMGFQHGDAKAFEALYQRYKGPIFSFLLRQHGQRASAEELTQEVFVRVVRRAATFKHGSKFSTWLFTIARNLLIDALRRKKHRNHDSLERRLGVDGPTLKERVPASGPQPDRATTAERLRRAIEEAIQRLPDDQREVFLLREYSGLRFSDIAEIANTRIGTVKSRMRYALEALRKDLSEYTDYARTLP